MTQGSTHRKLLLPIRVYYEDTDAGGVVYHSNYINYFERARTELMRQLGYELDELAENEKLIFVVRTINCEYLLPAKFNDELFVSAEIIETGKTRVFFKQEVMKSHKGKCITLTKGEVTVVSVDADKFKAKRIPIQILESLGEA